MSLAASLPGICQDSLPTLWFPLHLVETMLLFSPVGFNGNLSLLDICVVVFSRALKQMETPREPLPLRIGKVRVQKTNLDSLAERIFRASRRPVSPVQGLRAGPLEGLDVASMSWRMGVAFFLREPHKIVFVFVGLLFKKIQRAPSKNDTPI